MTEYSSAVEELLKQDELDEHDDTQIENITTENNAVLENDLQTTIIDNNTVVQKIQNNSSDTNENKDKRKPLFNYHQREEEEQHNDFSLQNYMSSSSPLLSNRTVPPFSPTFCLDRDDVYRMICYSFLFLIFCLPCFVTWYAHYFPVFFIPNGVQYNTIGVLVISIVISFIMHFVMR